MKTLHMLKDYHNRIAHGHAWGWRNDFDPEELAGTSPGEAVRLESSSGVPLGTGFANPLSHIAFRLMTREDRPPDESLVGELLDSALEWRRRVRGDTRVRRLVYGESDGLPGLAVDQYGDVLVLSQSVAGMEPFTNFLVARLVDRLGPETVIVKNTNLLRRLEGLPLETSVAVGEWSGPVTVDVDGVSVVVDCVGGRKTGLFLDHRENRRMLSGMGVAGARVLDLFSHCGLWGLALLRAGAAACTCVDSDGAAAISGSASAVANGWEGRVEWAVSDAAAYLRGCVRSYDVVVLDPPAIVKKKRYLKAGLETYAGLVALSLARVAHGGLFVASSCSSFVTSEMWVNLVRDTAAKAGHRLQLVATGTQAIDHPVLASMPETAYLKCLFFRSTRM